MNIKVNGEQKNYEQSLNVTELLRAEDVEMPDMVSVQLNGDFLERATFDNVELKDNDEVDFLYFMGGGSFGF